MPSARQKPRSFGLTAALTSTSRLANSSNEDMPQPSSQVVLAPLARTTSETA